MPGRETPIYLQAQSFRRGGSFAVSQNDLPPPIERSGAAPEQGVESGRNGKDQQASKKDIAQKMRPLTDSDQPGEGSDGQEGEYRRNTQHT